MKRHDLLQRLIHPGLIAIMRASSSGQLTAAAHALKAGGVEAMEVTATTPGALEAITQIAGALGREVIIGVGSVLDPETCRAAILAGAQFVVTPVLRPEVIRLCHRYGVPIICGAYSPTEALTACEEGADLVKIFPAEQLGPQYIKSLLAPMPQLPLVPTGGITPENVGAYLAAGATALGVGSGLVNDAVLRSGDWARLTAAARAYHEAVLTART